MYSNNDVMKILSQIDFGSIDGLNDKHLQSYFIDNNYWNQLINGKIYYVIGRKGTGKSAIYTWLYEQQAKKGVLIENMSFNNFPFEKLLNLKDDDFSKPNQYQSIWRNIILSEICSQIVKDVTNPIDDEYNEIKNYVLFRFGADLTELHKKVTTTTEKTGSGLKFKFLNLNSQSSNSLEFGDGFDNITAINNKLEKLICSYLKRNQKRRYIIQFDQLDDNYSIYINNQAYFQCIISLFKAIYSLNQSFDYQNILVKTIAYLRSDIFYEINSVDSESSRWDDYKYVLNWAILNKRDWINPPLLQLINKRISVSYPILKCKSPFHTIFDDKLLNIVDVGLKVKPFKYLIHRTFHRPRDLVQFCKYIQKEVKTTKEFDYRSIFNAEKEYSNWLLSEVSNEIGSQLKNTKTLYAFLRTLGDKPFTKDQFTTKFLGGRNQNINKSPQALMRFLYTLGVISNINYANGERELYSIIRNERTQLDDNLKMILHSGLIKGLHTYQYDDK
jgi:hypothetical protein